MWLRPAVEILMVTFCLPLFLSAAVEALPRVSLPPATAHTWLVGLFLHISAQMKHLNLN